MIRMARLRVGGQRWKMDHSSGAAIDCVCNRVLQIIEHFYLENFTNLLKYSSLSHDCRAVANIQFESIQLNSHH